MIDNDIKTIYQFEGCVDQNILSNISYNINNNLNFQNIENLNSKKKKLLILSTELIQNIIKHSNNYLALDSISLPCFFNITHHKNENSIVFNIKNTLDAPTTTQFINKLDFTNSLSEDEIVEHYKLQLKNGFLSEKQGAGLGLFEIRRIIKNKIVYNAEDKTSNDLNFAYSVTLNF